eukprot:XP_001706469.1 Hypothetical protein GL50803_37538 [Giardia lamblia ATCC 50803]
MCPCKIQRSSSSTKKSPAATRGSTGRSIRKMIKKSTERMIRRMIRRRIRGAGQRTERRSVMQSK